MCKNCDLSGTSDRWKPGLAPPVPDAPGPSLTGRHPYTERSIEDDRWSVWRRWWFAVLDHHRERTGKDEEGRRQGSGNVDAAAADADRPPSSCVVCPALRSPPAPSGSADAAPTPGGACCGHCGMRYRDEEKKEGSYSSRFVEISSELKQREVTCRDPCVRLPLCEGGLEPGSGSFAVTVPFVCDSCWAILFPCLMETYEEREAAVASILCQKHGIDKSRYEGEILKNMRINFLTNWDGIKLSEVARVIDYDHAMGAFFLDGGRNVPACGTLMWRPRVQSAEEAADLIAQRYYLRNHTGGAFKTALRSRLDHKLADYAEEIQESGYGSDSDPEDVLNNENVEAMVDFKIRKDIVEAEVEVLDKMGGLPQRWPWVQDDGVGGGQREEGPVPPRRKFIYTENVPFADETKASGTRKR